MGRYVSSADGALEVDRGSDSPRSKRAQFVSLDEAIQREDERAGADDLDRSVQAVRGKPQSWKDVRLAYPRTATAPLGHPAKRRPLLGADDVRTDLSSRQKKDRSKAKHEVLRRSPQRVYNAVRAMIGHDGDLTMWRRLNDQLSDAGGDLQQLREDDAVDVRRVDRFIQAYERRNDRGHVVYANAKLPYAVNHTNIEGFARNQFEPGAILAFDRYTVGAHSMHQTERSQVDNERTIVFEIQTRRGAYLGASDGGDDTGHLLPRGQRMRIVGSHVARFRRPDGSHGRRVVVQLEDADGRHRSERSNA